jgi:hypothetical protein
MIPTLPLERGPTGFSSICPPTPPAYPKASPRSMKCPAVAARVATTSAKSVMAALSASRQTPPLLLQTLCSGQNARLEAWSPQGGRRARHARSHTGKGRTDGYLSALTRSYLALSTSSQRPHSAGEKSRIVNFLLLPQVEVGGAD